MGDIYRKRLLELASYLDNMKQDDLVPSAITIGYKSQDGTGHEMSYPEFAVAMPLHNVFPTDWTRNQDQIIALRCKPNSIPFTSFCYYFNLTQWEYMHLFVSYFQDKQKYGGHVIFHENVKPNDISNNIYDFVERSF